MHRRSWRRTLAVGLVAMAMAAACGGDDGGGASEGSATDDVTIPGGDADSVAPQDTAAPDTGATPTSPDDIMPEAPPDAYVGLTRIANLAVLPDGSQPELDIWARRSFEYAPILLVEALPYAGVTDYFGVPDGMSVVAVPAGAGPDAEEFTGLFAARDGQQYTNLIVYDRDRDAGTGLLLEEVDDLTPNGFPEALPGQALVQLYAYQLRLNALSEGEGFDQRIAGVEPSFNVGIEGIDGCAPQPRQTDAGFSPMVLGGTQRVPFDLDPGTTTFTFHGWGSTDQGCLDPSVIDPIDVDVEAGERWWVILHSGDGVGIEALLLEVP